MDSNGLPGASRNQDRSEVLWITLIIAYALSFVVLILRFITRKITNALLWWDDWFIIAAFVSLVYRSKCSTLLI